MEQAYGFTPTHTEQYISPTIHMCKKYNFQIRATTQTQILTETKMLIYISIPRE